MGRPEAIRSSVSCAVFLASLVLGLVSLLPAAAVAKPGDILVVDANAFPRRLRSRLPGRPGYRGGRIASGSPFVDPRGIALAADGQILIADPNAFGTGAVLRVDPARGRPRRSPPEIRLSCPTLSRLPTTEGSSSPMPTPSPPGLLGALFVDRVTERGRRSHPERLADPLGTTVQPDGQSSSSTRTPIPPTTSSAVFRVDPASGARTTVASGAPFVAPKGIALPPDGQIYVADGIADAVSCRPGERARRLRLGRRPRTSRVALPPTGRSWPLTRMPPRLAREPSSALIRRTGR